MRVFSVLSLHICMRAGLYQLVLVKQPRTINEEKKNLTIVQKTGMERQSDLYEIILLM